MSKVTDTYRHTIELFWTGNHCMSEIARTLGVSRQRIHQIVHDVFSPEFISTVKQNNSKASFNQRRIEEKYGMPYEQYAIFKAEYEAGRRWHPLYTECVQCGTTKVKYYARGLCARCYPVWLLHTSESMRESRRRAQRRWTTQNKEKITKYNRERWLRTKNDPFLLEEYRRKRHAYNHRKKREKENKETHLSSKSKSEG